MISRRNIRIKVMQNLYALKAWQESEDGALRQKVHSAQQQTLQHLEQSSRMFIQLLFTLCKVAEFADKDARQRAAKYLPTEADKNVSTKISRNAFVQTLQQHEGFQQLVKDTHLQERTDNDLIKELYLRLITADAYKEYIQTGENDRRSDKKILAILLELLMEDEDFEQFMDDLYMHWQDDKPMMKILVTNYLNKPGGFDFKHLISQEKEEYALELIRTVMEKRDQCMEWIKPRLQNWDPERVAVIDMLLLYMGVCEFLYFPSIPPKVTINEYIDLGKVYSTPQSGHFINGVLDNVLKTLRNNGKLNKTERAKN